MCFLFPNKGCTEVPMRGEGKKEFERGCRRAKPGGSCYRRRCRHPQEVCVSKDNIDLVMIPRSAAEICRL